MSISKDPLTVPFDRLIELMRGLGLDPVEPVDIRRVTIDPMGIKVVRYRRTEEGGIRLGFADRPLTETIVIGFDR